MDSNLATSSITEQLDSLCPIYLAMGMSQEEYWHGPPYVYKAFRDKARIERKQRNTEAWYMGQYMLYAISQAFTKNPIYPEEPLPIDELDIRERKERELRLEAESRRDILKGLVEGS